MGKGIKNALVVLVILLSGIFYYHAAVQPRGYVIFVEGVKDGDTLKAEIGDIRLLGVNTPENNLLYYEESRDFLKDLVLNNSVNLEIISENERDKYGRTLAYVFYKDVFINQEILKEGYGNLYFYKEDKYTNKLAEAEKYARDNEKGIWKKSENYGCIEIVNFETSSEEERLVLENKCEKLEIVIKDNANHIYKEKLKTGRFEKNFSHVWNNDGDSLFIWDEQGLVLFLRY